jgi:hypothetical protein
VFGTFDAQVHCLTKSSFERDEAQFAALLSFAASVKINGRVSLCARKGLKLRGWLLVVLFAHVMLHPWVHAIGTGKAASDTLLSAASFADQSAATGDQCELCRVGHNATLVPKLPTVELLNPRWIHVALQAANYASLQSDRRLPSRAPPLFS